MSRVAVIGAGASGLGCAAALHAQGHDVRVFDKSRGPGGRCATRRSVAGTFDHGAPRLGGSDPAFVDALRRWAEAQWVIPDVDDTAQWLAVPGMNALARQWAGDLQLQVDTEVAALEALPSGAWALRAGRGPGITDSFDAVVVAVPAEQAAVLLGPAPALADALRGVRSDPCWTVMAAWPSPLPLPAPMPSRLTGGGPLALALHDSARPQRAPVPGVAQRWVLHAQAEWSRDNLDVAPQDIVRVLLDAFSQALGHRLARPSHAVAHRWRYAQVPQPLAAACGWDAERRLGACGDAWHAGDGTASLQGIERAWLSGRALARQIGDSLA